MTMPSVTVCIPTYNGAVHLAACLDSVCSQTYRDLEILVVDDCSSDQTPDIVAEYQKQDGRVCFTRNESNLGLVGNLERCITLAGGEYIKFALQDDVLYPRCVEALMGAMRRGVRFAFCAREFIAEDESSKARARSMERARTRINTLFADKGLISPEEFSQSILGVMPTNVVGEPTVTLMHRSVLTRYGRFNPDFVQLLDFEFWCRVGANESICFVPEVLAQFRVHPGSATSRNIARRLYRAEVVDHLVLLHEFAFSPLFRPLRDVAGRRRPPMDLADVFYEQAHRAIGMAREKAQASDHPDRAELDILEALASRYPALLRHVPLKYTLAREWRSLKRKLRGTESSHT